MPTSALVSGKSFNLSSISIGNRISYWQVFIIHRGNYIISKLLKEHCICNLASFRSVDRLVLFEALTNVGQRDLFEQTSLHLTDMDCEKRRSNLSITVPYRPGGGVFNFQKVEKHIEGQFRSKREKSRGTESIARSGSRVTLTPGPGPPLRAGPRTTPMDPLYEPPPNINSYFTCLH